MKKGFPDCATGKEPACRCRRHKRHEFDPWVGKILWSKKWHPAPVCCLENCMDRGDWWSTVHWVERSQTQLKQLNRHACHEEK